MENGDRSDARRRDEKAPLLVLLPRIYTPPKSQNKAKASWSALGACLTA